MKISVVGCGNMGKNHARILRDMGHLDKIVEPNFQTRNSLKSMGYGRFLRSSIEETNSDAYVVATPSSTHFTIVADLLTKNKHVLVEKPAFIDPAHFLKIKELNNEKNIIAVGHVERFNPAVRELSRKYPPKTVNRFESYRYSSRPQQVKDVGVWLDLGVHDIDIMIALMGIPKKVLAYSNIENGIDISFHANFEFKNGASASINASWLSIAKRREIYVYSDHSEAKCDLLLQCVEETKTQKLEILGDNHFAPKIQEEKLITVLSKQEPLRLEIENFIESISDHKAPLVGLDDARIAENILESAYESAMSNRAIEIK